MTTPAGQVLAQLIAERGPIPFSEFMNCALYHPQHGYYRNPDVVGKGGDFYTAEQLQPVFGRLIATDLLKLTPPGSAVLELGAGLSHMEPYFQDFDYTPFDIHSPSLPRLGDGIVFSNEFFDALPVDVVQRGLEVRVDCREGTFQWSSRTEDPIKETQEHRLAWLRKINRHLDRGYVYTIDYGYTEREKERFPQGTLMSYQHHVASPDVLRDPGLRDITAHVNFSALISEGERLGWETVRFETLSQALLRIGNEDEFASALKAADAGGRARQQLQLKTLLFGMGETFRVLLQKKNGPD